MVMSIKAGVPKLYQVGIVLNPLFYMLAFIPPTYYERIISRLLSYT